MRSWTCPVPHSGLGKAPAGSTLFSCKAASISPNSDDAGVGLNPALLLTGCVPLRILTCLTSVSPGEGLLPAWRVKMLMTRIAPGPRESS